jgi:hypothetical protein
MIAMRQQPASIRAMRARHLLDATLFAVAVALVLLKADSPADPQPSICALCVTDPVPPPPPPAKPQLP